MAEEAKEEKVDKNVEDGKLCAILAYLLVGIIWYFADEKMKKNGFAKFHVKQGLVLLILWVIFTVANNLLWGILFIGWLMTLLNLGLFVLLILGIINAANGAQKRVPIIGGFANKFTF